MKWTALSLLVLLLYGSLCDSQVFDEISGTLARNQQQGRETMERPLVWTYPSDPTIMPEVVIPEEIRHLASATSVSVNCGESIVQVTVQKDMFGIGQLVDPRHLTLGSCGFLTEDTASDGSAVIIFQSELTGCDSTLSVTETSLIYRFLIVYSPAGVVLRVNRASVSVECHYQRIHNVSSTYLVPHWVPFSATKVSEEFLYFTLKLMTDDWQHQRSSYSYVLGTSIRVEASVMQYFHVPLRIFVDRCVVSVHPDPTSQPNYSFIENGCLVDSLHSSSRFLNRGSDDKLRFELAALMFQGYENAKLYITCYLTATSINFSINNERRACTYHNVWQEASGVHEACNSCSNYGPGTSVGNIGIASPASPSATFVHTITSHTGVPPSTGSVTYNTGYTTATGTHGSGTVTYPGPQPATGSHTTSGTVTYARPQPATGSHTTSGTVTYARPQPATGSHTTSGTVTYTNPQPATGSHTTSGTVTYTNPQPATGSHTTSGTVTYTRPQPATGSHTTSGTVTYTRPQPATGSHTTSGTVTYTRPQPATGSHTTSGTVTYTRPQPATGSHTTSGTVTYTNPQPATGSHTTSGTVTYTNPQPATGSHTASGSMTYVKHQPGAGSASGTVTYLQPQPGTVTNTGPGTVTYVRPQPATVSNTGSGTVTYVRPQPGTVSHTGSASTHSPNPLPPTGSHTASGSMSYVKRQPGAGSASGTVTYLQPQPGTVTHIATATGGPGVPIGVVPQPGPATGSQPDTRPQPGSGSATYFSNKLTHSSRARRDVPENQGTVMQWESQVTLEIIVNQNTDA